MANAQERYEAAVHAMQSGVALSMPSKDTEPKHLRVGVNAAMCDHAALARLLMEKGIINQDEYFEALAVEMEAEVQRYKTKLSNQLGADIDLA